MTPMDKRILDTLSSPAFWRGAANTRAELMRRYGGAGDPLPYHRAIGEREAIAAGLAAGIALESIPAFRDWQATTRRPAKEETES